jgi:hypothetical protein
MAGERRGIPASQLARDYGVSLKEFSDAIIRLIAKELPETGDSNLASRRPEICAAVSAAMTAALNAATLVPEERDTIQRMVSEVLLPYWAKHCDPADNNMASLITTRAEHYFGHRVQGSQVKSAVGIVAALLDAMQVPAEMQPALKERLVPAFAHRMVGDVYRINEVRRNHGIELSLMATACALLQISVSYDAVLRALRLV